MQEQNGIVEIYGTCFNYDIIRAVRQPVINQWFTLNLGHVTLGNLDIEE